MFSWSWPLERVWGILFSFLAVVFSSFPMTEDKATRTKSTESNPLSIFTSWKNKAFQYIAVRKWQGMILTSVPPVKTIFSKAFWEIYKHIVLLMTVPHLFSGSLLCVCVQAQTPGPLVATLSHLYDTYTPADLRLRPPLSCSGMRFCALMLLGPILHANFPLTFFIWLSAKDRSADSCDKLLKASMIRLLRIGWALICDVRGVH